MLPPHSRRDSQTHNSPPPLHPPSQSRSVVSYLPAHPNTNVAGGYVYANARPCIQRYTAGQLSDNTQQFLKSFPPRGVNNTPLPALLPILFIKGDGLAHIFYLHTLTAMELIRTKSRNIIHRSDYHRTTLDFA